MVDRTVARRYAEAFVNAAEKAGRLPDRLQELKLAAQTVQASKPLRHFLGSPQIGTEEKEQLLRRVWAESLGREVTPPPASPAEGRFAKGERPSGPESGGGVIELLRLLLSWGRVENLPEVAQEAVAVAEERQGVLRGRVITKHPISSAEASAVAERVGRLLRRQVVLERAMDPAILGGVRVVVGSAVLDGSVQAGLEELRRQLKAVKVT